MKKEPRRRYISLYFKDRPLDVTKKRYLTVSFSETDPLYDKCNKLGSAKIKRIIGIGFYRDLTKKAREEDRTLGNYIKYKLRSKLL